MKVSVLSTSLHPFAGYVVNQLIKKLKIDSIIIDEKGFSDKDRKIWSERTSSKLEYLPFEKVDVELIKVESHLNDETMNIVNKRSIDLLLNLGTPRILSKEIIDTPNIGVLNCHPGILPDYRGCTCVEWALYNNDLVGNTCHIMSNKIDEGPIIYKKLIDFKEMNSYQEIRRRVYLDSITCFEAAITLLKDNNLESFEVPIDGKYYKPIEDSKMKIIYERYGNEFDEK